MSPTTSQSNEQTSGRSPWHTQRATSFDTIALALDQFIHFGRALEAKLMKTEEKVAQLERELKEAHALYDRLLRDEKTKSTEAALSSSKLQSKLKAHQESEQLIRVQFSSLSSELAAKNAELKQYQERWSSVLQREAEAKVILADSEVQREQRLTLEKRLQQAEATVSEEREMRKKAKEQVAAYRRELEHAVRSVEAMSQARVREHAELRSSKGRYAPEAHEQAPPSSSERETPRSTFKIQPGMSWMSPRASSDDNPAELFEAELASWRDRPLAPQL